MSFESAGRQVSRVAQICSGFYHFTSQIVGHQNTGVNIVVAFSSSNLLMSEECLSDVEVTWLLKDGSLSLVIYCFIPPANIHHSHGRKVIYDKNADGCLQSFNRYMLLHTGPFNFHCYSFLSTKP